MDLTRLQYFLVVMKTKHFARAAETLGLSQPAVSKSIKALEDDLGVKLFERGQFGAEPTPFAEALSRRAHLILAESRIARAELDSMRGARKGQLTIGVGISFAPRLMPEAIERFRRRWPAVGVRLEIGFSIQLFGALIQGDLDFVLSAPPAEVRASDDLVQRHLFDETDCIVAGASHPLAVEPPRSLMDIAPYPWIVSPQSGFQDRICRLFLEAGLKPPSTFIETSSEMLTKGLLQLGPYLSLLGRELYSQDLERGQVAEIDFPQFRARRPAMITHRRRGGLTLPARNMISVITEICALHHHS